jgi:hypothetical protein
VQAVVLVVMEGEQEEEASWPVAEVDVRVAGLEHVVAGKETALGRATAPGTASTTTMMVRASADHDSIPTGLIRRIMARVGITNVVDVDGMAAMVAVDGMTPTDKGAIINDMCHFGSSGGSTRVIHSNRNSRRQYLRKCQINI